MASNNSLNIKFDEHNFQLVDEGIYRATEPYKVDVEQWMFDEMHVGIQAIVSLNKKGEYNIKFISVGGDSGLKLIKLFNTMLNQGERVEYIEGAPAETAMGEIYV